MLYGSVFFPRKFDDALNTLVLEFRLVPQPEQCLIALRLVKFGVGVFEAVPIYKPMCGVFQPSCQSFLHKVRKTIKQARLIPLMYQRLCSWLWPVLIFQ